ncbi:MAG: type I secretion system permease/ATPase [Gammaproteobacteria bacterium]|nr:type I secretion system permease/ATPase [Gammaproteobacteria bacterium]
MALLQSLAPRTALAQCRGALTGVGIFSCAVNILMLTGPLFMLQVYDRVLASGSLPTLTALVILLIALYALMGLLELVRSRVLVRVGAKLDESLRDPIFESMMSEGLGPTRVGSNRGQALRDLDAVRQFTSGPGPFAFFDMPWVPVYLAVIFIFHNSLGWFALLAAGILFALAILNETLTAEPLAQAAQASEKGHALAEEGRRAAETVKAMGMGSALKRRWLSVKNQALATQGHASDRAGLLASISKTLRLLFQSGMLALGAWLAIEQQITPGMMIAGSILMGRALAPVDQAIAHWRGFQSARQACQRISERLHPQAATPECTQLPKPQGALDVEGLAAWAIGADGRPSGTPIISGVRFSLRPGDGLGIIGPSGAGKTTLAKALLGLWPLSAGQVRLDGATFDQWDSTALGQHIGYLPQDGALFHGTVAENIARFELEAPAEAIIAAAVNAGAHDLILNLANGYETQLGQDGQGLSGGQRQRVALARALYRDPCLIVMDEPNANLDAEGDAALTRAIASVRGRGGVVIVIAHRPSAIVAVDLVLMMRDGQQVAFGPKEDVLRSIVDASKKTSRLPQRRATAAKGQT